MEAIRLVCTGKTPMPDTEEGWLTLFPTAESLHATLYGHTLQIRAPDGHGLIFWDYDDINPFPIVQAFSAGREDVVRRIVADPRFDRNRRNPDNIEKYTDKNMERREPEGYHETPAMTIARIMIDRHAHSLSHEYALRMFELVADPEHLDVEYVLGQAYFDAIPYCRTSHRRLVDILCRWLSHPFCPFIGDNSDFFKKEVERFARKMLLPCVQNKHLCSLDNLLTIRDRILAAHPNITQEDRDRLLAIVDDEIAIRQREATFRRRRRVVFWARATLLNRKDSRI